MNLDLLREYCLSKKGTTEEILWGEHLVFKVAGKMFCITSLDDATDTAFKVIDEDFERLPETGIYLPAPHLQRAKWVKVLQPERVKLTEWKERIETSYQLVKAKLPKKIRTLLDE
ncbi:MAG: MmcQ/YjbR family DNA-binding protein [Bacteroidetes bacterium]|nr:MmcQ/YjbR family DNA-binding protein [Bacteroidota bacterium]